MGGGDVVAVGQGGADADADGLFAHVEVDGAGDAVLFHQRGGAFLKLADENHALEHVLEFFGGEVESHMGTFSNGDG